MILMPQDVGVGVGEPKVCTGGLRGLVSLTLSLTSAGDRIEVPAA